MEKTLIAREGGRPYDREEIVDRVKAMAREMYDRVVGQIIDFFNGKETIVLFRSVMVEDTDSFIRDMVNRGKVYYEGQWKGVGVYWAWDFESAASYWGEDGDEVVIESEVGCDDIDFLETVKAFLVYSGSMLKRYDEEADENEVRLKEGRKILLKSVYRDPKGGEIRSFGKAEQITSTSPTWIWT